MPLSEEELRLLEQMERALSAEDPKFASTLRGTSFRRAARRRAVLAGAVFAGGVTVLMSGAILEQIAVGIVGFVIMLLSATYGLTAVRSQPAAGQAGERSVAGDVRARRARPDHTFMERLEDRWRRRRDDGR